jgi:hypothetical protein
MKTMKELIKKRLSQLSLANLGGEHTSGGDASLPKDLRGGDIGIDRMPSIDEVLGIMQHRRIDINDEELSDEIDAAICAVALDIWRETADLNEWPISAIDDVCFDIG